MKGRPRDPRRARRQTGHRPKPGELTRARELIPTDEAPPPAPADLPEGARWIWDQLAPDVQSRRPGDLFALRLACVALYRAITAGERIEATGLVVRSERGPIVNPLTRLERDAATTAIRIMEQLGLTLAARLRLGVELLRGATLAGQLEADLGSRDD